MWCCGPKITTHFIIPASGKSRSLGPSILHVRRRTAHPRRSLIMERFDRGRRVEQMSGLWATLCIAATARTGRAGGGGARRCRQTPAPVNRDPAAGQPTGKLPLI